MRLRATAKMVAFHDALKSLPLAHSDYIHKPLALEEVDQYAVTSFDCGVAVGFDRTFADELHRRHIVLRQMPTFGLAQLRFLHEFHQADLRAVVSVFGLRLVLRDHTRSSLQHGRRMHIALRIEELRHADLFPQNSCYLCHFLLRPSLAS